MVAFLDRSPVRPGHVQIVPRDHYPYFDDLPPEPAPILAVRQALAKALKRLEDWRKWPSSSRAGDVPHAHAHVVPLHAKTNITSRRYIAERELTFRPAPRAPHGEHRAVAERLRAALAQDGAGLL